MSYSRHGVCNRHLPRACCRSISSQNAKNTQKWGRKSVALNISNEWWCYGKGGMYSCIHRLECHEIVCHVRRVNNPFECATVGVSGPPKGMVYAAVHAQVLARNIQNRHENHPIRTSLMIGVVMKIARVFTVVSVGLSAMRL